MADQRSRFGGGYNDEPPIISCREQALNDLAHAQQHNTVWWFKLVSSAIWAILAVADSIDRHNLRSR